jgi:hypothetical protein
MNDLAKKFWLPLFRDAEGEGGAASGDGSAGIATGEGAGDSVAGAETSAPEATFLSGLDKPAEGEATQEKKAEDAADESSKNVSDAPTLEALKLPEGVTLDPEVGKSFLDLLTKPDLPPQERAQELINLHVKAIQDVQTQAVAALQEANMAEWKRMNESWRAEIAKLPEFAENPEREGGKVLQGLKAVGADEKFFQALDLTGAGNHPAIVQVLHRLTARFVEGGAVSGSSKPTSAKRLGDNIYTSTVKT